MNENNKKSIPFKRSHAGSTDTLNELLERREELLKGGGEARIEIQHQKGKYTARERIKLLIDPNSFNEVGAFVKHDVHDFNMQTKRFPGDGVVTGSATINGRLVYIYSQDFTCIGGTLGYAHAQKIVRIMDLALKSGAPLIGMSDSGGARIQEGVSSLAGYGDVFYRNVNASGVIPQITAILGPSAGGGVYSPALNDFVFMTENTSYAFVTGPEVVKTVTGEDVSFEELGGTSVHGAKSGVAHFVNESEEETMEHIKKLLSYLPSNNLEDPPILEPRDVPGRIIEDLDTIIPPDPKDPYDIMAIILRIVDDREFLEVQENWAKNIVVGFARLNGYPIGVVANQPNVLAGALNIDASTKAARFIRFCDAFNIPLVTLVDVPGFLPGVSQEHQGIIRHGAKLLFAYSEATVPKLSVITRKAVGGAYICMSSKHLGGDINFAWHSAEIAVMGPEGATKILYRREIAKADDPERKEKELQEEYRQFFANPFIAAEKGYIDDVIQPSSTRVRLINSLWSLLGKRETRPKKKHGNIPL